MSGLRAFAVCAALVVASLPALPVQAGDPATDTRIYDSWRDYVASLPPPAQVTECESFLRNFPDSIHTPKVQVWLVALRAGAAPAAPAPSSALPVSGPAAPPPEPVGSPAPGAEAAAAMEGVAGPPATGSYVASHDEAPASPPPAEASATEKMRVTRRFSVSGHFGFGTFSSVEVGASYCFGKKICAGAAVLGGRTLTNGAGFAGGGRITGRTNFMPWSRVSLWAQLGIGYVAGDVGSIFELMGGFGGFTATGATFIETGPGVEISFPPRTYLYASLTTRIFIVGLFDEVAFAPSGNVGVRVAF